jgi:hypothetical protein
MGVEVIFLNRELGRSPEDDLLLQVQGMMAEYTYCMPLSCVIQHMVYQSLPTSITFSKAIPRRRKEDRRVGLASRGPRERWCRVSSRVRPHGYPGSRCGTYAVQLLGVSRGCLP